MEAALQSTAEKTFRHHLHAFTGADAEAIMKDYTEQSELLTPQGPVKGLAAIQSFFEEVFRIFPAGSTLEVKQEMIRDNLVYVVWRGESVLVQILLGTDTFIMEAGKIKYQTLAAQIIPKQ